jgi:hypothetical protein
MEELHKTNVGWDVLTQKVEWLWQSFALFVLPFSIVMQMLLYHSTFMIGTSVKLLVVQPVRHPFNVSSQFSPRFKWIFMWGTKTRDWLHTTYSLTTPTSTTAIQMHSRVISHVYSFFWELMCVLLSLFSLFYCSLLWNLTT